MPKTREDDSVASTTPEILVVHRGVRCDVCRQKPIRDIRYKCCVCEDYDLCGECKAAGHHAQHRMQVIWNTVEDNEDEDENNEDEDNEDEDNEDEDNEDEDEDEDNEDEDDDYKFEYSIRKKKSDIVRSFFRKS
jgi:cobalamin biosynthesis protein CobT